MPMPTPYLDRPLDEALNYATHIEVTCGKPTIDMARCGHSSRMLTSELVRLCPGAVTRGEFVSRLKCKGCGARGWAMIRGVAR